MMCKKSFKNNINSLLDIKKINYIDSELDKIIKEDVKHFIFKEGSYLIKVNNKTIGFFDIEKYEDYLVLESIEILKEYKNKGFGKKTIKWIFENFNVKKICGKSIKSSLYFYKSFPNSIIEYNKFDDEIYFTLIND